MNFFQDSHEEPNDIQRRIFSLIELQQECEALVEKSQDYNRNIKENFDRKVKENTFYCGDMVLRSDAKKEKKGKHGKFDNLWLGPFVISKMLENNTFIL